MGMVGLLLIGFLSGVLGAFAAVQFGAGFWGAVLAYSLWGTLGMLGAGVGRALVYERADRDAPDFDERKPQPSDTMSQWLEDEETAAPARPKDDSRAA